jgi:hypothetical protein
VAKRNVFTVQTPLGYRVGLSRDRWRQIIRYKHPALAGHEKAVQDCLKEPELVRESTKEPDVHLYYQAVDRGYLCVVTAPTGSEDHFVVTTYFTRNIKPGRELWKK